MALKGTDVVSHHKSALGRCTGKLGWDLLSCIVDEMRSEYKKG